MNQLKLGLDRQPEKDRNHHLGGRSFYFFDFDDNILFLTTSILVFRKDTGQELAFSSADWALNHHRIGKPGPYADYEIRASDADGSFRHFRDHDAEGLRRLGRDRQLFVDDLARALELTDVQWQGPSWECFYHAVFNQRPVALITARGHHPDTIREGIRLLVAAKLLPFEPNYLAIYPVSAPEIRVELGDPDFKLSVAELKQRAIRASVVQALQIYGDSPHHRFGMSDDDPKNIQLVVEEMRRLKRDYPAMSFFIIETPHGKFIKREVTEQAEPAASTEIDAQLSLFEKDPTEV